MSGGKSLAMMPWFPRDFIASTRAMRIAERGAYRELLDFQWEMGRLPRAPDVLARLLGIAQEEFDAIWPSIAIKFMHAGEFIYNQRLEQHREKALSMRQKKAAGAALTNAKRYAKRPAERVAQVSQPASNVRDDIASPPSPSPSPISKSPKPPLEKGAVRQRRSPDRAERDRALIAWTEVVTAEGATEDTKAQMALRAIGGYSRIRLRTVNDEPHLRSAFCEAYRAAS
jgi:uncharacterized protein YdaU (DUF1376 family)